MGPSLEDCFPREWQRRIVPVFLMVINSSCQTLLAEQTLTLTEQQVDAGAPPPRSTDIAPLGPSANNNECSAIYCSLSLQ